MSNPVLLIVDDDEDIRSQLKWAVCNDYEVVLASDRSSALEAFRAHKPSVILLDLGLPPAPASPAEGLATLSELLAADAHAKVIILSGQSERANALRAVDAGAYDFLAKPPDTAELKVVLKRATEMACMERELAGLRRQLHVDSFEGMLGSSPSIQTVFATIRKVSGSEASVLLLGESGTGKEVAARAIHRKSTRHAGTFVAINCGAIPETLLESELFGHEKGAFTGAHVQRPGRIETASGGTLFLDEIGELPLSLQVKLLRFLQEQKIERVGGRREIDVDTRVIAATNVDLKKAMQEGKFREDLFYRVAVVSLKIPPLRERTGDIPLLAQAFLQRFAAEGGRPSLRYSPSALRALEQHSWPGNVREMENRVRRAVIMAESTAVKPADLELADTIGSTGRTLREGREALEREMLEEALRKHGNKVTSAALELGISRPTMYEMMDKFGISRKSDTPE